MLKLIGLIILSITGTLSGYSASQKISKRVKFLEQYLEFVSIYETEMRYTVCPVTDIIEKHIGNDSFYLCLKKCNEHIKNKVPLPIAWKQAIEPPIKDLSISDNVSDLIYGFGDSLGASDVDGQISHCKYHIEAMKPYFFNVHENKKVKSKLYSILGTCFGAVIALLFI